MKIFISIKFEKDGSNNQVIEKVKNAIIKSDNEPYCFADEGYIADEKAMMSKAIMELNNCDLLIAEISECAFGVGIEVGYMMAKNKHIISIKNIQTPDSPTIKGVSDKYIVYSDLDELEIKLLNAIKEVIDE